MSDDNISLPKARSDLMQGSIEDLPIPTTMEDLKKLLKNLPERTYDTPLTERQKRKLAESRLKSEETEETLSEYRSLVSGKCQKVLDHVQEFQERYKTLRESDPSLEMDDLMTSLYERTNENAQSLFKFIREFQSALSTPITREERESFLTRLNTLLKEWGESWNANYAAMRLEVKSDRTDEEKAGFL